MARRTTSADTRSFPALWWPEECFVRRSAETACPLLPGVGGVVRKSSVVVPAMRHERPGLCVSPRFPRPFGISSGRVLDRLQHRRRVCATADWWDFL
jgi:hypothetical protein